MLFSFEVMKEAFLVLLQETRYLCLAPQYMLSVSRVGPHRLQKDNLNRLAVLIFSFLSLINSVIQDNIY